MRLGFHASMAEPATATAGASHLDSAWHRRLLDELCAIERPSASPGEREAAEWLAAQLRQLGIEAGIESEPAHGTFWWPLGIAAAAGLLAGAAALHGRRALGMAAAAAAGAAAIDDLPPLGGRRLRSLLPKGERTQVLARLGPEAAERTVVLSAHHDAAHCGLIFNPEIPEAIERRFPGLISGGPTTSPPLIGGPVAAIPSAIALGAAAGSRRLTQAGTIAALGALAVLADIGRRGVSPGANDNGTGVVALLAIARALAERPPENLRVLLLSTSEEATCDGMQAWFRRSAPTLPREDAFFICLETLGSPHLLVLRGEGMVRVREYPARSLALMDGLAEELGIPLFPNLRLMNATDGVIPLAHGYECATLCSCTDLKQAANYHWPTDTPDNVDYETLADAIRLTDATLRRLDQHWF
jgi:hypothetical protein